MAVFVPKHSLGTTFTHHSNNNHPWLFLLIYIFFFSFYYIAFQKDIIFEDITWTKFLWYTPMKWEYSNWQAQGMNEKRGIPYWELKDVPNVNTSPLAHCQGVRVLSLPKSVVLGAKNINIWRFRSRNARLVNASQEPKDACWKREAAILLWIARTASSLWRCARVHLPECSNPFAILNFIDFITKCCCNTVDPLTVMQGQVSDAKKCVVVV